MRPTLKLAFGAAVACWSIGGDCSAEAAQTVRVLVHVPADTPADAAVYLAGSLPSVGAFQPDGVKLSRQADGSYAGELELEPGQTLEFKITLGSWEKVEKNADGSDRPNRTLTVDAASKGLDVTVERWGTGRTAGAPRPSTVVGDLKLHTIDSRSLNESRTVRVWLPPNYDAASSARFPVLYMHDGQNCFDRATSAFGNEWEIDETLTRLIRENRVPPLIVVGVDNGLADRINEYTYDKDPKRGGGKAAAYAEFLLDEVKPFVDKTYRTHGGPEYTFLGGSSLGGLVSLEIARRRPNVFGGVIAMSPAISWADNALTTAVERDPGGLATARVWIDVGVRENLPRPDAGADHGADQRFVDAVRRLDAALAKHRVEHRLVIDDEHPAHNEPAWAARFPQAVEYVVGAK